MTKAQRHEIFLRFGKGQGVNQIAREMGLWSYSVRYQLDREKGRKRDRDKRRAEGAATYSCGLCGRLGHNALGCPDAAE